MHRDFCLKPNCRYLLVLWLFLLNSVWVFGQAPTIAPTNLQIPVWGVDGNQLTLQWTNGNGARRIVVARVSGAVNAAPIDGADYNAASFGMGDQLGIGNFVVYKGSASSAVITGLQGGTNYHFAVFECNGVGAGTTYLLNAGLANGTTVSAPNLQPSNLLLSQITGTTAQINVTAGNGSGRLYVLKAGSPVDFSPVDLTTYSASTTFGTAWAQIGATGNFVISNANINSFQVTNLQIGLTYYLAVFERNGNNGQVFNTNNPLIGQFTTPLTPTVQTSNLFVPAWGVDGDRVYVQWTNGNGARRIVVAKQGSAVTASPINGVDYNHNNSFGLGDTLASNEFVVYDGNGSAFTMSNLNPNTPYFLQAFEYNGSDINTYYLNAGNATVSAITLTAPTVQATNLQVQSLTGTTVGLQVSSGNGSGRIFIMKAGSAVDVTPTDLVNYAASATFGTAWAQIGATGNYVVSNSSSSLINVSNLDAGQIYHVAVFEYNGSSGKVFNLTNAAVTQFTTPTMPTVQATNLVFPAWGIDGDRVYAQWTNGNGARRVVVAKMGGAVSNTPIAGNDYVANTAFGLGASIGPGEFVVYNGTSNAFTMTGLLPNTNYHFAVFEYNGMGATTSYQVNSPAQNQVTTIDRPSAQPTNLQFNNITGSGVQISLTAGNGTGRLVVIRAGAPVNINPIDLQSYSASTVFGTAWAEINGSGNFAVAQSNITSFTVSNLSPAITYYVAVFEFNGNSGKVFNTVQPLIGNFTTIGTPTVSSSKLLVPAWSVEGNSMQLQWTPGNGSGRLVIARIGAAVSSLPTNGIAYVSNNQFGQGAQLQAGEFVVYAGAANSINLTGLTLETVYHFAVFDYNGTGAQTNYFLSPAIASFSTAVRPTVKSSSFQYNNITGNAVTLSFTAGNGQNRIILAREAAMVASSLVDYTSYSHNTNYTLAPSLGSSKIVYKGSGTSATITGLNPGTIYHFSIVEFNGNAAPVYQLDATDGSVSTLGAPATPASNLMFSLIEGSRMQVSWTNGTGNYRLVAASETVPAVSQPVNGLEYVANHQFGLGNDLGGGNFAVFAGTGNTFNLQNLQVNTNYYLTVYEFNGTGMQTQYLIGGAPQLAQSTAAAPTVAASNLSINNVTVNSMQIGWTNGNGQMRVVVVKPTDTVNAAPIDLISYPNNQVLPLATGLGNNNWVVYAGTGSSFVLSGLAANTTYHLAVFEANGSQYPVYQGIAPLTGSALTLASNQLTINPLPTDTFCLGGSYHVGFTALGNFNPGNVFTLELVSGGGSVVPIGSIAGISSGMIPINFNAMVVPGSGYRFQVSSSNPPSVSADNGVDITILPALQVVVLPASYLGCVGDTLLLTANILGQNQWYRNGVPIIGANSQSLIVTQSGDYIVIASDGTCTNSSNLVNVQLNNIPSVPAVLADGPLSFCVGQSVTLSAPAGFTYQWYQDGIPLSETNQDLLVTSSGNYQVMVANGNCTNLSLGTWVTVNPIPTAAFIQLLGPDTVCAGTSFTLSSDTFGLTTQWFLDGMAIAGTQNQGTFTGSLGGNYTIRNTVAGCYAESNAVHVEVIGGQTLTLSSHNGISFCTGDSIDLVSSASDGNIWQVNGLNQAGLQGQQVNVNAGGIYQVLIDAGNGCYFFSNTLHIAQYDPPTNVAIDADGFQSCPGDTINLYAYSTLSNQVVVPLPPYFTYQWFRNQIAIMGANQLSYGATQTGDYHCVIGTPAGCEITSNNVLLNFNNTAPITSFVGNGHYTAHYAFPLVGGLATQFRFEAIFTDADGDMPLNGYPRLELDVDGNNQFNNLQDLQFIMQEVDPTDLNTSDGKLYYVLVNNLPVSNSIQTRVVSRDANNCLHIGPLVNGPNVNLQLANLYIFANDITFSSQNPAVGDTVTIAASIHNNGAVGVNNVLVSLFQEDTLLFTSNIPFIGSNATVVLDWKHAFTYDNFFPMKVVIDTPNAIVESNEFDNFAIRPIIVGNYQVMGAIDVVNNYQPGLTFTYGSNLVLNGIATYQGTDEPVAGATVTARLNGNNFKSTYTNAFGAYSLTWMGLLPGTYILTGEVTDFTLTKYFTDTIYINAAPPASLPDLIANIQILTPNLLRGDTLQGLAFVRNAGSAASGAFQVTLNICLGALANYRINNLNPGESDTLAFSQVMQMAGYCDFTGFFNHCLFTLFADANNEITELNEWNNSANNHVEVKDRCADLRIEQQLLSTQNLAIPFQFSYNIINRGGEASGAFRVTIVDSFAGNGQILDQFVHVNLNPCQILTRGLLINFPTIETHLIYVFVDDLDQIAECNETNNVGISYNIPGLPDLMVVRCFSSLDTIQNLSLSPNNLLAPQTYIRFTVKNNGISPVAAGTNIQTRITVNGQHYFHDYWNGLASGAFFTDSVLIVMPPAGNNSVVIVTDFNNIIPDAARGNNSQTIGLCTDFVAFYSGWPTRYTLGSRVALPVGLLNAGLIKGDSLDIRWIINNVAYDSMRVAFSDLHCDFNRAFHVMKHFNQVGNYAVRVELDYTNQYSECNETNNVLDLIYEITNPIDYRVLSQFINPSELNPDPNEAIDIYLTYQNIGSAAARDSIWMVCTVDNVQIGDSIRVPPLGPGQFTTIQVGGQYASNLVGPKTIRSYIDAANEEIEGNELNNEASRVIIVGDASNLFVHDIVFSNQTPQVGENVMIQAFIGNNGFLDNEAQIQFLYINLHSDTVLIGTSPILPFNMRDTTLVNRAWQVLQPITQIIVRIINVRDPEFNPFDNEKAKVLGGIAPLSLTANMDTLLNCFGAVNGLGQVSASGGLQPYQFFWSNGSIGNQTNNLSAGNGYAWVRDALNQTDTIFFNINQPDSLMLNFIEMGSTCVLDSVLVTVNGGTAPFTFSFAFNNGTAQDIQLVEVSNTPVLYLPVSNRWYHLTVTDALGCSKTLDYMFTANCVTPPACPGTSMGQQVINLTDSSATLLWQTVPMATRYRTKGMNLVAQTVYDTVFYWNNLLPATTYTWELRALIRQLDGTFVWSNWETCNFTTPERMIDCQNFNAHNLNVRLINVIDTAASFAWDYLGASMHYQYTLDTNSVGGYITTTDTAIAFNNLQANNSYTLYVRLVCPDSTYAAWTALNFTTLELTRCLGSAMGQFVSHITPNSATLNWQPVPQANSYRLRSATLGVINVGNVTNYHWQGLSSGNHVWEVRAYIIHPAGNYFTPWSVCSFDIPVQCENLNIAALQPSVNAFDTIAQILWQPIVGVYGYQITLDTNHIGGFMQTAASSWWLNGLVANTTYRVFIRAYCANGSTTAWTNVDFTTQNVFVCSGSGIGQFVTNITQNSAKLHWSPIADAVGYRVRGTNLSVVNVGNNTTYFWNGLMPGNYTWEVRALIEHPAGNYWSPWYTCSFTVQGQTPKMASFEANLIGFPNPFINETTILLQSSNKQKAILNIFDMQGRLLQQTHIMPDEPIQLGSNWATGHYIAEAIFSHGERRIFKITKTL